jgi:hypothetical protein
MLKLRGSEGRRALLAGVLAPLSLALWIPLFSWAQALLDGERPLWTIAAAIPLAFVFGYAGFVIFGIPLYGILLLSKRVPVIAVASACVIGGFAALVTPQLLEAADGLSTVAWGNLRTLAATPSFWIDYISLSGAATGVVFWLLARPGRDES